MMQVGKTALNQRANEIDRQRRTLIGAQQQRRVWSSLLLGESSAIDHIAAITGQRLPIPSLRISGARLCILARDPPDSGYPLPGSLDEHQAHLQKYFQFPGDGLGITIFETLGAITPLQQETFAARRLSQLLLEVFDFPACHQ